MTYIVHFLHGVTVNIYIQLSHNILWHYIHHSSC